MRVLVGLGCGCIVICLELVENLCGGNMNFFGKEASGDCPLDIFENLFARKRPRPVEPAIIQDENNNTVENSQKKKLEVLYDGYFYDVTDFIERHPGGKIMELYTESGEDATIAIHQFHYRSLKMVLARMKGLKKRPALEEEGIKNNFRKNTNKTVL